jgi:hypothetical protein
MREQSDQQNKKFREIKDRTASIRKRYEEQQKRSIVGMHELHIQSPRSYAQGLIHFIISNDINFNFSKACRRLLHVCKD